MKNKPTVEKWEIRFSKKFTDNILPGGYGNDLIIDKEDVEPLMKFIKKEIKLSVQEAKVERDGEWVKALKTTAYTTPTDNSTSGFIERVVKSINSDLLSTLTNGGK